MTPLPTLLDRVRKADGPDRELDAALALAIGGWKMWKSKHGYWNVDEPGDRRSHMVEGRSRDEVYDAQTGRKLPPEEQPMGWAELANVPEWTASIDAALALVEQVLPGCAFTIQRDWGDLNRCSISTDDTTPVPPYVGDGQSLPLAILAALLSALIARQGPVKE